MKTLEIITHCWNYHEVLCYQLSSLVNNKPKNIIVSVCIVTERKDINTRDIVEWFVKERGMNFYCRLLDAPEYFNRGYGRNLAAKQTKADIIWFADCDYMFGEGCLDTLVELELEDDWLYFSRIYKVSKKDIKKFPFVVDIKNIDSKDFEKAKFHRAIGGCQIVTGNTARNKGYYTIDRRLKKDTKTWNRGRSEDIRYRHWFTKKNKMKSIILPNLFRIYN